jgi:RNA polymerase sigma factor (sigma-70 family)
MARKSYRGRLYRVLAPARAAYEDRKEHRKASALARSLQRMGKEATTEPAESPARAAQQKDLVERVLEVAACVLSEEDCQALRWFHLDGLPALEIAARLNCTEPAVWQRLSRARQRIREAFPMD